MCFGSAREPGIAVAAFSDVPYGYSKDPLDFGNKNRYHLIKF